VSGTAGARIGEKLRRFQKPLVLLVIVLVLTALAPQAFPTGANFRSILLAISIFGVMACGTVFTILLGGIDLSVGAVAAMGGAALVQITIRSGHTGAGVLAGVGVGLLLGALVGAFHALVIDRFGVPPFLVTLATLNVVYGAAQLLTGNLVISCMSPPSFAFLGGGKLLGMPFPIHVFAATALAAHLLMTRTTFGRHVYAVGGNPIAARFSGVSVGAVTGGAYVISGLTAAAAGMLLASMNQQAIAKAAQGYENDVLTAVVVGGASLLGGEGSVSGALFGALLVGLLNNGLRLLGVPSIYHGIAKGVVIVAAIAYDAHLRQRGEGLSKVEPAPPAAHRATPGPAGEGV
jgi:ribose/xylose/arabinose/galactoside ABC-type transport system permease subunit